MAKPFSIQAPEDIAKEYAGNKQKIAQAAQMGIVDPTAAVLAGMFIDRMRSAQVMEAAQQPTVAQQVLGGGQPQGAPPALQQGMGPPPQGMPMPPQGMGPPPQGMPMAPPPQMPMAPPPQGMAAGGLTTLPVPASMFDEPDNGSYAGGGMIAFASGATVDEDIVPSMGTAEDVLDEAEIEAAGDIGVSSRKAPPPKVNMLSGLDYATPDKIAGFNADPYVNLDRYNEMAPRASKRAAQLEAYLDANLNPETQKKRRKEDINMAMIKAGIAMANTPGSLFQSASAGIGAALPGFEAANKERRASERDAINTLVAEERTGNKELQERADAAYAMAKEYGSFADAMKDRAFKTMLEREGFNVNLLIANIQAGAGIRSALINAQVTREGNRLGYDERRGVVYDAVSKEVRDAIANDPRTAVRRAKVGPMAFEAEINKTIMQRVNDIMPRLSGGGRDPVGIR